MPATLSLLSPPPPMAATTTFPSFTTTLSLHPPRIPFFSLFHSHLTFKPISFPSLISSSSFTSRANFNPQYSNQDEYEDDDDDEDIDYDDEDDDEDERDEYKEGDDDDDDDKEDYYKDGEDKRRGRVELVEEDFNIDLSGPETETEEEVATAYEKLYGPGFSGQSYLGNDVYEMDAEVRDELDDWGIEEEGQQVHDGFEDKVIQVRRITKVVKGGKIMRFRAVVIVGDRKGMVGVGHGKAGEVVDAVRKAGIDGRRHLVKAPLTKYNTFPHRMEARYGAAKVMIRPARPGSGLQAGAVLRTIIDMCGVQNALGKQLGSDNALNNARAAILAIGRMRSFREVAQDRGIPMEELWK